MSKDPEIHILGIRHHGPGSARSLLTALEALQVDVIAIEMMDDKVDMLELLNHEDIHPPISLLLHLKNESTKNVLLPFASFSPEWQALQYARTHEIDIERIDLPYAFLSQIEQDQMLEQQTEDVLAQLAHIAGFEHVESWWDHYLEREGQSLEIFQQLQEIMEIVRAEVDARKTDLLREAYMRIKLRKLGKKYDKIAVVCGAFHGPVLTKESLENVKGDQQLIKGLKRSKVDCSLIPFSYHRLSKVSGYSSGVVAPLFYEMLFKKQEDIAAHWFSHAAHVLREKGFTVSVDEVMSAVQLSIQLCQLRGMRIPGLAELEQAALSTLCHGHQERLKLLIEEAFIGHKIGHVPEHLITSPFIKDFYSKIKSFRLSKYWQPKDSGNNKRVKSLDLRKSMHLASSHFLHQLDILNIQWASETDSNIRAHGSFHEDWRFHWDIEDEIQIHHQSTMGATVEQATEFAIKEKLNSALALQETIYLLNKALLSDITDPVDILLGRLNELTAASEDLRELLSSNIRLIEIAKYGSVRNMNTEAVEKISSRLHSKICNLLPYSCPPMDEDASLDLFKTIAKYYQLLKQIQFESWMEEWVFALELLKNHHPVDARVSGFALRMLYDLADLNYEFVYDELAQRLDSVFEPMTQAIWLEGFLYGGGSVLMYNEDLFQCLSKWVEDIDRATFEMVLPILNRSFATFSNKDRQEILAKVRHADHKREKEKEDELLLWSESNLLEAFNKLDLK